MRKITTTVYDFIHTVLIWNDCILKHSVEVKLIFALVKKKKTTL